MKTLKHAENNIKYEFEIFKTFDNCPKWLKKIDVEVQDGILSIDKKNVVTLHYGTWKSGEWKGGIFEDVFDGGEFDNGTFNGIFEDGIFNNGIFNGDWKDGEWNNGEWNGKIYDMHYNSYMPSDTPPNN